MGIPFVPTLGYAGSDVIKKREDFVIAPNPFNPRERVVVAKSIRPDVALFHGAKGDRKGNVLVSDKGEALMLIQASKLAIVSVEEIVDKVSPNDDAGTFIPSIHVKAVVHAPFGAYPTACPGKYGMDVSEMKRYLKASNSDDDFSIYLTQEVFSHESHDLYILSKGLDKTVALSGSLT